MEQRMEVSRFIEDLTVSNQSGWYSVISLHGGGSPEAMKARDLAQLPPVMEKVALVESLLEPRRHAEASASPSSPAAAA